MNKKYLSMAAAGGLMVASMALALPASAATTTPPQVGWAQGKGGQHMGMGQMRIPGVFGTVASVSGNTITVTSKMMGPRGSTPTTTTYTVDATNATVTKNNAASSVSAIAVGDTVIIQGTVSGTSVTAKTIRDGVGMAGGRMPGQAPGVFGTVASVSGNTITVTSKFGPNGGTATTYTVDATNATVTKNGTTSSVSGIAVGDTIMAQGTLTGTNLVATTIRDGMGMKPGQNPAQNPNAAPVIAGNGEPIIAGNVTAISGNTLTVTNKSNQVYTVDATSAKIAKANVLGTIGSIAVGDNVIVQGTVNGNSITAFSVTDQGAIQTGQGSTTQPPQSKGIFGAIGSFFSHLFGF